MKKLLLISLILTFSGCAYFNIYYNAEKYYKDAVSTKEKNTRDRSYISKADSTISKASKLIQYYPKSDLVDNALLLMAKAYVLKGGKENYSKAVTKLDEIQKYYKHNDIEDQINYLYAYILFKNEDYEDAIIKLGKIKSSNDEDVVILKAKCLIELGKDNEAIKLLEANSKKKISKKKRINLYEFLGDLYSKNGKYDKSEIYYNKILKLNPDKEKQYSILLKLSKDKIDQGKLKDALGSLNKLKDRAPNEDKYNLVNLSIADIYEKLDNYDKAYKIYDEVMKSSRNDSITLRAIDRSSLIEENVNNRIDKAVDILKNTDKIRLRDSLYYNCRNRYKSLNEIMNLTKIDSVKADSLSQDSLVVNKLRIAELYAFNLNHPDRAKAILFSLYNSDKAKGFGDKILYTLSWLYKNIYAESDSANYYENLLLEKYPDSFYSKTIKYEKNKISSTEQ